jgi:hypothetical protein
MAPLEIPFETDSSDHLLLKKMVSDGRIKSGSRAHHTYIKHFDKFSKYGYDNFKVALERIRNSLRRSSKAVHACKVDCRRCRCCQPIFVLTTNLCIVVSNSSQCPSRIYGDVCFESGLL